MRLSHILAVGAVLLSARVSLADGLGTTVGGSLRVGGVLTNVFNSANGEVPAGYGNSGPGAPLVVIGNGIEFGAQTATDTYTADFTGSTLEIKDVATGSPANINFLFIDTSFAGFSLSGAPAGVTYSLSGSNLTVNVNYSGAGAGTYTEDFTYTTVTPEPSNLVLALTGLGCLAAYMLWQKKRGTLASSAVC